MVLVEYVVGSVLAMFIMFSIADPKSKRNLSDRESAARFGITFLLYGLIAYFGLTSGNLHIKALALPSALILMVSIMAAVVASSSWCGGKITLRTIGNESAGRWIFGLLAFVAILLYIA